MSADELADLSDDELAERAKASSDAFGVLYDRHVRRIYSYVYYRIGQKAEAEDLTERVFVQALENLPRYEFRGAPFSAWLFRIAHNLVANWHRDTGRHPQAPIEEADSRESEPADPAYGALDAEERRELRAVIARLPADRQLLLQMKFVEERSNADIATHMGRTEGAVKALLHRTLVALRQELSRLEKQPG
ncbi:MAG TPA: sigma-70 family RNA polymerase sigma factor [Chloroflexota bacterium]|nr:sigma-70 family RNA polymerase sigma factor [Chloroflexota bacterium]